MKTFTIPSQMKIISVLCTRTQIQAQRNMRNAWHMKIGSMQSIFVMNASPQWNFYAQTLVMTADVEIKQASLRRALNASTVVVGSLIVMTIVMKAAIVQCRAIHVEINTVQTPRNA
mmetsp:Transcript_36746/g.58871  ORF Transcript_36746/g.58871 Transcript_36746/m.58871 type:complete len:116 (+) Transcript_36746:540-887(+)